MVPKQYVASNHYGQSLIRHLDIASLFSPAMGLVRPPPAVLARAEIQTLPGPDVVDQATRVLKLVSEKSTAAKLILEPHDFGGCAIDKYGEPLPPTTLKACQEADAILMGELNM